MNQQNNAIARRQQTAPAQQDTNVVRAEQIWSGQLTPVQFAAVNSLAREYGLLPLLGHIHILGGKPYVGIDGWTHIANNHPQYDGMELRFCTREEKDDMGAGPDDIVVECKVWRKDRKFPGVQFGRANKANVAAEIRGEKMVPELAQARAIRKALRAAFSVTEMRLPDDGETELGDVDARGRNLEPLWSAVEDIGVSREQALEILGADAIENVVDLRAAFRAIRAHVQAAAVANRQTPLSRNEFIVAAGNIGFEDQGAIAQAFNVGTLREAEKLGSYEELLEKLQGIAAARVTVKAEIIQPAPSESPVVTPSGDVVDEQEAAEIERDAALLEWAELEDDRPVGMADDDFGRTVDDEPGELLALWSDYHAQRATAKREGVKKIPDMPAGEVSADTLLAAIAELGNLIAAAQRQQALV